MKLKDAYDERTGRLNSSGEASVRAWLGEYKCPVCFDRDWVIPGDLVKFPSVTYSAIDNAFADSHGGYVFLPFKCRCCKHVSFVAVADAFDISP